MNALVPDAARAVGSGEPGDRPRAAHLLVGGRAAAAGRPTAGSSTRRDCAASGSRNVAADSVLSAFNEFAGVLAECPPGCTHIEAGCALDDWVAAHGGPGAAARLDSLRRLLRSREGLDPVDTAAQRTTEPAQARRA